jgi:hypothetical protein
MKYNKRLNTFYKVGSIKLEEGKTFKRNYNKLYNRSNNIARDHYLLTNTFNVTKLIKRNNNNNNDNDNDFSEDDFIEENKEKYKLNIYNYKELLGNIKNSKLNTKENELLRALLIKIDEKNFEELSREKEELISFRNRSLKGVSTKNVLTYSNTAWKTFNKTNSVKTLNNLRKKTTIRKNESLSYNNLSKINKNNNSLSIDINSNYAKDNNYFKYFWLPKNSKTLNKKLQGIFNVINAEEKLAEKNTNLLNTINRNKNSYKSKRLAAINLKSHSVKADLLQRRYNFINNLDKIRYREDIDKILFKSNKHIFNAIRNKLHGIYKKGQRIPKEYFEKE